MPSRDSLTKSSTALISFFTPASQSLGWPSGDRSAGPTPAKDLVDPPAGALNGLLPLRVSRLPLVLRPLRLERPVHLPVLAHLVQRGPVADGQPGQVGGAECGRLGHLR